MRSCLVWGMGAFLFAFYYGLCTAKKVTVIKHYDIIVIGSGPAGSNFARMVSRSYKVAVIDKSHLANERPKPCGGLLSPDAQNCLARYGLTLPKEILVTPQIFAVKTVDFNAGLIRHYQRSYLNMDRQLFDDWLRSLVPDTVDKINGRCVKISGKLGGFTVTYKTPDGEQSATAKYIVGADGAGSLVRRTFFPNVKIRSYLALQRWYSADNIKPFYSCIFDEKTSDCCSWSISKDGFLIYGGAFAKKNSKDSFEAQLISAKENGFTFDDEIKSEACLVYRPKRTKEIICGKDGVLLLGEAGGFISPSSLEGISWALRCGEYAACAFNSGKDPEQMYKRKTQGLKLKLWLKMLKCPFMYNPLLRRTVMKLGINAIKINTTDERN